MSQYFPSTFPEGRLPHREYFFNVLNAVHPVYLQQLLEHAHNERNSL